MRKYVQSGHLGFARQAQSQIQIPFRITAIIRTTITFKATFAFSKNTTVFMTSNKANRQIQEKANNFLIKNLFVEALYRCARQKTWQKPSLQPFLSREIILKGLELTK